MTENLIILLNGLTPFATWVDVIALIVLCAASVVMIQIFLGIFLVGMTILGGFLVSVILLLLGKKID